MTRICGLGIFVLGTFVAGCFGVPIHFVNTSQLSGSAVAQSIVRIIGAQIKSYDPSLVVGAPKCPDTIEISSSTPQTCTLTVDNVPLRVNVTPYGQPPGYHVEFSGSLFERRSVERMAAAQVESAYGGNVRATCPMKAVVVATAGESFACRIDGLKAPAVMHLKVGSGGFMNESIETKAKRRTSPFYQLMKQAIVRHNKGEPTMVDGVAVADYIDRQQKETWRAIRSDPYPFGNTQCPSVVDISGTKRAWCTEQFDGQAVHFDFWIEGKSVSYRRTDAILDLRLVESSSEQMIGQALATRGIFERAQVTCNGRYEVVPVASDFYCDALIGSRPAHIRGHVTDPQGHANFNIVFDSPTP